MILSKLRSFLGQHPVIANSLNFGTLAGLAELTQQTLERKIFVREPDQRKAYDWTSMARYTVMGGLVLSPVLYAWYKWLDGRFPSKAARVIAKKVLLDAAVMGFPFYSAFYMGMALAEGRRGSHILEEWKSKIGPTYLLGLAFWLPAQSINFRFVAPKYRVTVIGLLTFAELNVLCLLRRINF